MTTDVEQLIIARLDRMENKLDGVTEQLAELRGSRKVVAGIASAIGAAVGASIAWWKHP